MANRMKEDDKNEKIIRGLLKLPGNRKCINCNTLGPQYVCTTFSTFVCTTCGGIHREFTHRVKSVSMAKFTPQEIASLQAGGNERAKEIYFKDWDPQRQSAPDTSNVDRLRDFIKHVYVNRKYSGERGNERPPQGKLGDKEEPFENRRSDGYQSGSRSPPYDGRYDRRSSGRSSPGYDVRRSPGYDQQNHRHSDYGRSPVRPGIINDWQREDRFSNRRKSDDHISSDGEGKIEIGSPDNNRKDGSVPTLPTVRPVAEILGDNVVPLRVSEPPKANNAKILDVNKSTQRTASSSRLASSNGNPAETKMETSLIDFDAEPEPPKPAITTQADQSTPSQVVAQSTPSQVVAQSTSTQSDDNWAFFDSVPDNKPSQTPPQSMNPLESVLTELSVPNPGHSSGSTKSIPDSLTSNGMFPTSTEFPAVPPLSSSPLTDLSALPSGGAPNLPPVNGVTYQQSGMQSQQPPLTQFPASQPVASQFASFPSGSNSHGLTGNSVEPLSQVNEVKPNDRKELPADLFTATYSYAPYQAPGWQGGVSGMFPGMGYPMQYNPAMSMRTYPQLSKPSNPFDAEGSSGQAGAFPSMSSLHAALPNASAPTGVAHVPNQLTLPSNQWMPPQLSTVPPVAPSFGSAMAPGMYMAQQPPPNMTSSRPQGFGSSGSEGPAFGLLNQAAPMPNPSLGGNPFG